MNEAWNASVTFDVKQEPKITKIYFQKKYVNANDSGEHVCSPSNAKQAFIRVNVISGKT